MEKAAAAVSSIFIYPLKSCRGISVPMAPLTPYGFRWDRNWLIVNYKGRAYTLRVEPKLAFVEVELPHEAFSEVWVPTKSSFMVIKAPGMSPLKIPLTKPNNVAQGVSLWEWSGSALDEGNEAAEWFSNYLGKPSRLVRFNTESETRPADPEETYSHYIMFSDIFPYLLVSQGSLDALNERTKEPIPLNRFRANILVDGCEPFAEDLWKEFRINKLNFEGAKLCDRCKIPTIDISSGIAGPEPTKTLLTFRSDKILRPHVKPQGKVYFGQNLVWKDNSSVEKGKVVKVGDPVFVLKQYSSVAEVPAS
ncbi:hypothetical protein K2173_020415 [Erythroxylum novogranatense]|uniref:MOSC domain-containing protein n=1 Tax=Erythroxylum novogranatense TaxID=1862640 RepID=A0AAV8TIV2_9ROSI|nr:hypothetical protein K2173_020415 [Erythroxylum novogranatense]